jgi:uncharacterized protein YlxW (UPF0749 family)
VSGGPPSPAERAALAAALEQEEARVRKLEKERADATARVAQLRERDHEFATDRSDEFAEWVP